MQEAIKNTLSDQLNAVNINLPALTIDRLGCFIDELLIANQNINLTSITDEHEAAFKHLFDALLIINVPAFQDAQTILDIGSGAGIPGIPLAIAYPDKTIYSLEATQKKVNFQLNIREKLKLDNFFPVWNRAETLGHDPKYREHFDLVIARAVAAMNILLELMIPFTKINSYSVLYKGKDAEEEISNSTHALKTFNSEVTSIYSATIPFGYGDRNLITVQKYSATPGQFPRKAGVPQKKPL